VIINQIQGGRWDEFLRRLLPVKDRSIAPIVASELVGQIVVQEWEPEFYKLRNENLCMARASQAPVAAEFGHCKIRNPELTGTLVILEQIWLRAASDMVFDFATEGVEIAGFTQEETAFRDLRSGGLTAVGVTKADVSIDTNVAMVGGDSVGRVTVLALDSKTLEFPVILPPGFGFIVRANTVNVGITVTFLWRERAAEPSELDI